MEWWVTRKGSATEGIEIMEQKGHEGERLQRTRLSETNRDVVLYAVCE